MQLINPPARWKDEPVVIAAPGPSLTREVVGAIAPYHIVAVQDAWKLCPQAEVMYGCDVAWWEHHNGVPEFDGERWSSHEADSTNDKSTIADRFRLTLVPGEKGNTFGLDGILRYGSNSGFQAVNLAILFGACPIILVGFDMRVIEGKRHFFGQHPVGLGRASDYRLFRRNFEEAAAALPDSISIYNCTKDSDLTCFPMCNIEDLEEMLGQGKTVSGIG